MSTIAVDWSGARVGTEHNIWLAEVRDSELVRLESGRTRERVVEHLAAEADRDSGLVVGLDFALSFPAWFLDRHDLVTGPDVLFLVDENGERWLDRCDPPFWGMPGATKPKLDDHFRRTERAVPGASPGSWWRHQLRGSVTAKRCRP